MIRNNPSGGVSPRNKKTSSRGGVRVGRRIVVGGVVVFMGIIANVVYMHNQIVEAHNSSPQHPSSSSRSPYNEIMGERSPLSLPETLGDPSSSKSSSLREILGEGRIPENLVLQRLEKEFENTWDVCRNDSTSATKTMLRGKEEERSLAPPAFLQTLRNFTSFNSTRQNDAAHEMCFAPPSSSSVDQSSNYIMLFPTHSQDLQSIFLHCMKWLLDPAVAEIWLLLPEETIILLHNDIPYGNRILEWNRKRNHRLHLAFAPTLWEAVAQVDDAASKSISSVFWVNDEVWQGNHMGIHAGWERWKEDPSALVAARGWALPGETEGSTQDLQGATLTTLCPRDSLPNVVAVTSDDDIPSLVDLIGSFHHRDYLCFLRHPVLAPLQADAHDWRNMQWVMAWWLAQVTGRSPRTFSPSIKDGQAIKMQMDYPRSINQAEQDVAKDGKGDAQQITALLVSFFGGVTLRTKVGA
jgi:hypothetical protein